jgi:MarR family transcriptional regulator, transcriptional regulator for hemolysin
MVKIEYPLGRMLSQIGKGYLHLLRAKLQHLDIDRNYHALMLIESDDGNITQQELAVMLDTDKVSIVRVVDYLSEKGYVKRIRKTDDHRKYSLNLTEKAKVALPEIKQAIEELNQIVLNDFGDSKISELTRSIQKIKNNITKNMLAL